MAINSLPFENLLLELIKHLFLTRQSSHKVSLKRKRVGGLAENRQLNYLIIGGSVSCLKV